MAANANVHPSVGKVTTVRHTMAREGKYWHCISDLIFVGGVPTVVLDWEAMPGGDRPGVTVPLDPSYLHRLGWENAEYMYEFAVEDPREANP